MQEPRILDYSTTRGGSPFLRRCGRIFGAAIAAILGLVGLGGIVTGGVWVFFAMPGIPAPARPHLLIDAALVTAGGLALIIVFYRWLKAAINPKPPRERLSEPPDR